MRNVVDFIFNNLSYVRWYVLRIRYRVAYPQTTHLQITSIDVSIIGTGIFPFYAFLDF